MPGLPQGDTRTAHAAADNAHGQSAPEASKQYTTSAVVRRVVVRRFQRRAKRGIVELLDTVYLRHAVRGAGRVCLFRVACYVTSVR